MQQQDFPVDSEATNNVSTVSPNAKDSASNDSQPEAEGLQVTMAPEDTQQKAKYRKKTRTKSRKPDEWFQNVKKKKRNSGQAYQYKVRGNSKMIKNVEARSIGPDCNCRKKCSEKVGRPAIEAIFSDFWKLEDYDLQNASIQEKMTKKEVKRRRAKKDDGNDDDNDAYKRTGT